jgi:PhzF family phenazine biosynthesis protein
MKVFVVDAFTGVAFGGNPAGVVVVDDADLDDTVMQRLATELGYSETAFVRPRPAGGHDLRWFTPAVEVDLCGHATLATAHVLGPAAEPYAFHTRSGVLRVTVGADGMVAMDFPAQPTRPTTAPAGLTTMLGRAPVGVHTNGIDLLVELTDEDAVRGLAPDIGRLASIPLRGVIVTARGTSDPAVDFVSRFFAPNVGVDEDPVTGSAHCSLTPYWAERLGRDTMTGAQLSTRGGRVGVELRGDRVVLRGEAVTILEGMLAL